MFETIAFYLSFSMAVFLFARAYIEALNISESTGKVYGGTLIFCVVFGLIFSRFTFTFS